MSQPEETREKTAKVDDVLMPDILHDLKEQHRRDKAEAERAAHEAEPKEEGSC